MENSIFRSRIPEKNSLRVPIRSDIISVQVLCIRTTETHQALFDLRLMNSDGFLTKSKAPNGTYSVINADSIEYTDSEIRFYAVKSKYSKNNFSNLVNSGGFSRYSINEFGTYDVHVLSLTDDSSELHLSEELILTNIPILPTLSMLDLTSHKTTFESLSKYMNGLGDALTNFLNETLPS